MQKRKKIIGLLLMACAFTLSAAACSDGKDGIDGVNGTDGKSAYQIWLDNGYTGTETDFLEWLKGKDGADGKDGTNGTNGIDGVNGTNGVDGKDGANGTNGVDGRSAYQIWLDNGNTGSETDFLEWLKGANGKDGTNGIDGVNGSDGKDGTDGKDGINGKSAYQIWLDNGNTGSETDFLEWLKGEDGTNGTNGKDGVNGTNGKDGANGLSAYEIFIKHYPDYQGNEKDWITDIANNNTCNLFGHTYETVVISPTCQEQGYTTYSCSICEYTYCDNYTEIVAHNYYLETCQWCGYNEALDNAEMITTADGWIIAINESEAFLMTYCGDGINLTFPTNYNEIALNFDYFSFDYKTVKSTLETLAFPDTYVCEIADRQFYNFNSLKHVYIGNGITSIGTSAFGWCRSMETVVLGEGIKRIKTGAFDDCSNLTAIYYNAINVENIEGTVPPFELCGRDSTGITLYINQKVEVLPQSLFSSWGTMASSAPNIKKVVIPKNSVLTKIGYNCFKDCQYITELYLPSTIKTIETSAFEGCGVNVVYYEGTSNEWEQIDIQGTNHTLIDAKKYYYSETEPTLNSDGTAYDGNYWHYDTDGVTPIIWTVKQDEE